MRELLDWQHLPDADFALCLQRALQHADAPRRRSRVAEDRTLALVFMDPSLRTRATMELAAQQLGAAVTTLTPGQGTWSLEWRRGAVMDGTGVEHVRDAFGVLARIADAVGVRAFAGFQDYAEDRDEAVLNAIHEACSKPLINLESAFAHPCQALADAAALTRAFDGNLRGRRFVLSWAWHPKPLPMAVPNSALWMAARLGMEVTVMRPDGYALDAGVMAQAASTATRFGGSVCESADRQASLEGADVVYAKAWGSPVVYEDRAAEAALRAGLRDWQYTSQQHALTRAARFMHCLPMRRNVEVADAVVDGPGSLVLDQAELRLHGQKAILEAIWGLLP